MAEKPAVKNDLSWRRKLTYIWYTIRYSKRMAKWVVLDCDYCGYHELERIGKPIKSDIGGQKEFQQKYRCLHCGAIGIVTQIWVKERGEDGK
jgi:DNA-directed RNA polymerase subunit RPC12/RpoP